MQNSETRKVRRFQDQKFVTTARFSRLYHHYQRLERRVHRALLKKFKRNNTRSGKHFIKSHSPTFTTALIMYREQQPTTAPLEPVVVAAPADGYLRLTTQEPDPHPDFKVIKLFGKFLRYKPIIQ